MSNWHAQRNADTLRRLAGAVPDEVLVHAHGQRFVPALPRLAVESYWRAHPLRADRLARALAARSEAPPGWRWRIDGEGARASFRAPPSPYRQADHARGSGFCCICGQPVYRLGWHVDQKGAGILNTRAGWHACCVAAWKLWTAPNIHRRLISKLQNRRCAESGARLLRTAEVDHRIPLFRIWRDHRDMPWPDLLRFWGFPNLQVLNRPVHHAKSGAEAEMRSRRRETDPRSAEDRDSDAAGHPSARVDSPDWRFSGRGMPTMLNPAST